MYCTGGSSRNSGVAVGIAWSFIYCQKARFHYEFEILRFHFRENARIVRMVVVWSREPRILTEKLIDSLIAF